MAADIGVRIGIDGEREFRTALNGVNAQIRNLNSEMRAAVTSMAGMADEEETTARRSDILTRSIQATQQKIELITGEYNRARQRLDELGQALEDTKREFGENSQEALRAENAYNRQVATVNRLGTQLNDATADLNRMQNELRQTENAMEDMGDEARTMGSRVSDGFTVMKGAISDVVGDLLSSAVEAFKSLVGEALNAADSLTKFGSTMEFAGFDLKTIEESRKAVQEYAARTVYDLETVSNTTAQLAANGVKDFVGLTEAAGNLNAVAGGNADTFGSVALALTQVVSAGKLVTQDWNQIANAIPGASGKIQDALRENGAFVGNFREAMAAGEITAEEFSQAIMDLGMTEAAKEAASSVATIEGAIGNLQATIVDGLTGVLTGGGMDAITGFINGVTSVLETAGGYIGPLIESIKTSLSGIGEAFRAAFTPEQQASIAGFLENLAGALISVPFGLVATAVNVLAEGFKVLIAVGGAVADFFAGFPDGLLAAGKAFDNFKAAVAKSVTEALDSVVQWGTDLLNSVTESASGAVETVSTFFFELPGNVQGFVSDTLSRVIAWGSEMIGQAAETGGNFLSELGDFLSSLPGKVAEWISGAVQSIVSWGEDMKAQAGQKMQKMGETIKSTLAALPGELLNIGKNIVQGLVEGIKSKISSVRAAAQELAEAASSKVRSVLRIHSPSREFEELGEYLSEGFALGIESGQGFVDKVFDKLAADSKSHIKELNAEIARIEEAAAKRQTEKELADHQRALEEQYRKLEEAELEEREEIQRKIADLEADWAEKQLKAQEAAQEKALKSQIEALEATEDAYKEALAGIEDSLTDLEEKQTSMASKLEDYGDLFTVTKKKNKEIFELTDLQEDIDDINAYGEALEGLKARGVSDTLMDEILGMSVEDATAYTGKLLAMTDEEYETYIGLWEEKQRAAADIASRFYSEELNALVNEFTNKVPEELDALTEDLYHVGQMAGEGLAEGLWSKMAEVVEAAKGLGQAARSAVQTSEGIHSPATKWMALGDYMAQGVGEGFTKRMQSVAANITASIPSAASQVAQVGSGIVNGVQTAVAGAGGTYTFNLMLPDGTTLARYQLPALIDVARANGTPILNPT